MLLSCWNVYRSHMQLRDIVYTYCNHGEWHDGVINRGMWEAYIWSVHRYITCYLAHLHNLCQVCTVALTVLVDVFKYLCETWYCHCFQKFTFSLLA